MSENEPRVCVRCEAAEPETRLERCPICGKPFCADCSHRSLGRRFCSPECARTFYFMGENDDEDDDYDE